ncbi:MAG: hypothetical protein PHT33_09165, partial [bacterium]|nr:hypothetical protein [bacterium]
MFFALTVGRLYSKPPAEKGSTNRKVVSVYILACLIIIAGLWYMAPPYISLVNKLLATLVAVMMFYPFYRWFGMGETGFPFFELLCLHYFAIFVPPVFFDSIIFRGIKWVNIEDGLVINVLLLITIGSAFFLFGSYGSFFLKCNVLPPFEIN